jgi:UTP--glucose-1-phosphate uridylyltransferase
MNIKKAIIPAAGYGTRSLPITKVLPKEMFPIKGKPAIHYIVEEAAASGIEEILIIVSRSKNMIIDYFDRSIELETFLEKNNKLHLLQEMTIPNIHIQFVRQPIARGLGDALSLAKPFVNNEPFAVLLPDDVFVETEPGLRKLINIYKKRRGSVVGVKKVPTHLLHNYGVINGEAITQQLFEVTDLIEKPQNDPPSNLAVVGRYVLDPDIFSYIENVKPGSGGEIQLTDAIKAMLEDKKCYAQELLGDRYDIGSELGYFELLKRMYNDF